MKTKNLSKGKKNVGISAFVYMMLCLHVFTCFADMVYWKDDNGIRDQYGIVTQFIGGKYFGFSTNWYGQTDVVFSDHVITERYYANQMTYYDGNADVFRTEDGTRFLTIDPMAFWNDDYREDVAFAGYKNPVTDTLVFPYDRPSDDIPVLQAVWKPIPYWGGEGATLNARNVTWPYKEYVDEKQYREQNVSPNRGDAYYAPICWTTDTPTFKAPFTVSFPTYSVWEKDKNGNDCLRTYPYVSSVDYEVTLTVWTSSTSPSGKYAYYRNNVKPPAGYYKKVVRTGTVKYGESVTEIEISLGETLPEGYYDYWIEFNSDRNLAESIYSDNHDRGHLMVSDSDLQVEVEPKACDWQKEKGSLMLHWRVADADDMSDEESNSIIALRGKQFNIWRSVGKDWDDFSNAELVAKSVSGAYWSDNGYGKIQGVEPVKYWVQILTGKETDVSARPSSTPAASCVTRRRFGLAIGVGKFSKIGTTFLESEICQPANDIALFKELFYREYSECQGDYRELLNEDADLESVRKSFAAVRTNADGSAHAKPGDILLLYMAMHGEETQLALFDRYYSVDELHEDLKALDEDSGIKVIAMLMACHSGALTEATAVRDDTITIENKFRNIAWIASCRGEQKSTAIEDDTISLFGRCFLEFGWKNGNGDTASIVNKSGEPFGRVLPDGKADGVLTFWELAQYARNLAVGCSSKYKSLVTTTGDNILRTTDVREECVPSAPAVPSAPIQFEGVCINGAVVLKWTNDPNTSFYCVYYRKTGSAKWEHYRLVDPVHPIVELGSDEFMVSAFENTHDALNLIQRFINRISQKVHLKVPYDPGEKYRYVILDYGETYDFKVVGVNASGVGPCSYVIQGTVRDYRGEVMFNRVLEYTGNMQVKSGESNGSLDVRVAAKDSYTETSSQSSDGVPVEIVATYKRNGEDSIYTGEAIICSNEICTVALDGQDGMLKLEMSSIGILATLGEATAACLRSDDRGTFEIDSESLKQKSVFVESDVLTHEGTNATVVVVGGDEEYASNVKLYLMYNTVSAADLDLAKGQVDGVTPKGGLKFPLTLMWAKGEVGEKVITIPVKADKTVEDDEFFTLQLADADGMEVGEARVCTVKIHDPGYDELAAKVADDTATKAEVAAWNKLQKAKAPYVRGLADPADGGKVSGSGYCAEGKKVTLKATANKGFAFVGWLKGLVVIDSEREPSTAIEYIATTPSLVIDRTAKPAANSKTSTTVSAIDGDVTYVAKFVTAAEDAASIELAMNGVDMPPAEDGSYQTNAWAGVRLEWPLKVYALSAPTVKAAGLPAGVKLVQDKATGAYSLSGAPTAASKADKASGLLKPSRVKLTVGTAGKSSRTYEFDWTILPLPDWAVGTFNGHADRMGQPDGLVSMTVAANGKISGKLLRDGLTWTLSAPSFDAARDAETGSPVFAATVVGKSGKQAITNEVEAAEEAGRGVVNALAANAAGGTDEAYDAWAAWQNLWKASEWKDVAKPFAKAPALEVVPAVSSVSPVPFASGAISLKFAASGAVTASGKFVTGQGANGKDVVHSATCSSVLIPVAEEADGDYSLSTVAYSLHLYFPPNAKKDFGGHAAEIALRWDGAAFSPVERGDAHD